MCFTESDCFTITSNRQDISIVTCYFYNKIVSPTFLKEQSTAFPVQQIRIQFEVEPHFSQILKKR